MVRSWPRWFCLLVVSFGLAFFGTGTAWAAESGGKVYVVLWFDTEDYILPASDDAALRVADFLSKEDIRATFKVVGEKARTLERRKRDDVIKALKNHEIGYHSNYHSVQPTPAQYLDELGWDEGVAEFDRREKPGLEDVKRIFGVAPTCYGQPGSSWAPQTYGALRQWGMEVYLDAGSHVSLEDKPHYYCGVLNLYKLAHLIRADIKNPGDLDKANDRFAEARKALLAEGGGVVSIMYHPCEFVHKEFWDGVNFRNGANPPRDKWKLPPMKTADESRAAYQVFESYIRFIKRFPDVRFITASEAAVLYRDKARGRKFSLDELKAIALALKDRASYFKTPDFSLSAGESLCLLNQYVSAKAAGRDVESLELKRSPYGPTSGNAALEHGVETDDSQFTRTASQVDEYLTKHDRLPGTVWLGSVGVPPEDYLPALANVALELLDGNPVPKKIEVKPGVLVPGKFVASDDPKLWSWVIFPPGFRAARLMALAKKQAWTIKPALLDREAGKK
ncbi:MAG: polysaccharide deacetylase family protein [Gemmataceae bacterium]